jgi:xanthine/uracil permease
VKRAAYILGVATAAAALIVAYMLSEILPSVEAIVIGIAVGMVFGTWYWRLFAELEQWFDD